MDFSWNEQKQHTCKQSEERSLWPEMSRLSRDWMFSLSQNGSRFSKTRTLPYAYSKKTEFEYKMLSARIPLAVRTLAGSEFAGVAASSFFSKKGLVAVRLSG